MKASSTRHSNEFNKTEAGYVESCYKCYACVRYVFYKRCSSANCGLVMLIVPIVPLPVVESRAIAVRLLKVKNKSLVKT